MTLKIYILKTVFNIALGVFYFPHPLPPPHLMWLLKCVCVCVCVCVIISFFVVSCSVFLTDLVYFCLVTIVLSCQSCLQNVKQKPKNLSLLLLLFFNSTPPPL